jgi:hypothetical protein
MKQIKYLSWEETFNEKIMNIRKNEFRMVAYLKIADGFLGVFWGSISYILLYFFFT